MIAEFRNEEALHSGRIPDREAMYAACGRFHLGMLDVLAIDFIALHPGAEESLRHVVLERAGADAVAAANALLDVDGHGPPVVRHSIFRIRRHCARRALERFQSGSRKDHELSRRSQQFTSTQIHRFSYSHLWLMGIVANAASGIPGVLTRDDLRKRFRFGRVRLVANHAELCGVGEDGFLTGEVLRVASQRPMAGFASDIGMRTFAFCRDDVVVAGSAGFAAGEDRSQGGDFIEGVGTVMSILAELRGNEGMANRQESQHDNDRYARQPEQMFRALKDSPHAAGKQANAPPFATARIEPPRPLRIQAGKEVLRRNVAPCVGRRNRACAGSRR